MIGPEAYLDTGSVLDLHLRLSQVSIVGCRKSFTDPYRILNMYRHRLGISRQVCVQIAILRLIGRMWHHLPSLTPPASTQQLLFGKGIYHNLTRQAWTDTLLFCLGALNTLGQDQLTQ